MGNFYRVPCDKRGLNYDKYFSQGNTERAKLSEFNSNNTQLLTVEETKEMCIRDSSICNLECPLTDSNIKLQKSGPNLKASAQSVNVLSKVGFNIVSLANNHILDYGEIGVKDTIFACESKGIKTVGAANNFINARKPCIVENNGCLLYTSTSWGLEAPYI